MKTRNDIQSILKRALIVSTQNLGIQPSVADVLAILYQEKNEGHAALSAKELKQRTGLSFSLISVLCSRLEAEGIIAREFDDSRIGRGRRKTVYELTMSLDELFTLGISKYVQEIVRIYLNIKAQQEQKGNNDQLSNELLTKMENEILSFLTDNSHFITDDESYWLLKTLKGDDTIIENSGEKM